jgi:hypothetical protein
MAFDDVAADAADDVAACAVDVMVDAAATRRGFNRANFIDTMMTVEVMVKVCEIEKLRKESVYEVEVEVAELTMGEERQKYQQFSGAFNKDRLQRQGSQR